MKLKAKIVFEKELLESLVLKAWDEEAAMMQAVFMMGKRGNVPDTDKVKKQTESWCQGITRNLSIRLAGIFTTKKICFEVNGKKHVVLLVEGAVQYIVDGTLWQFKPSIKERVFELHEYPLEIDNPTSWA